MDVLGPRRERLRAFAGGLITDELDETLQSLVEEASQRVGTPIALVSLVLENIQFFRAFCGLPPDLALTRATDRDASFCQFVVRDRAVFEVNDARNDRRVPQDLVRHHGIAAYLGVPVMVGDEVLGALCVIDTEPRTFSAQQREHLTALGHAVSARLAGLAVQRRLPDSSLRAPLGPAFSELRNILTPLAANVTLARAAAAELAPIARLVPELARDANAPRVVGRLVGSVRALDDLAESLDDLEELVQRLTRTVVAVERATVDEPRHTSLAEVIEAADDLAHHATKIIGGVRRAGAPGEAAVLLASPRTTAVALLGSCLVSLAARLSGVTPPPGLVLRIIEGERARVRVGSSALSSGVHTEVARALALACVGARDVAVDVAEGMVDIAWLPVRLPDAP